MTISKHFWDNVDVGAPDDCWEWRRAKSSDGYGHLRFRGRMVRAHRFAIGAVDFDGRVARHLCNNRLCCNPAHIVLGSVSENAQDMVKAGTCYLSRKGSDHPKSRLTEGQVLEIRSMCEAGTPQREIAKRFGIHQGTVSDINRGKTWAHVVQGRKPAPTL